MMKLVLMMEKCQAHAKINEHLKNRHLILFQQALRGLAQSAAHDLFLSNSLLQNYLCKMQQSRQKVIYHSPDKNSSICCIVITSCLMTCFISFVLKNDAFQTP